VLLCCSMASPLWCISEHRAGSSPIIAEATSLMVKQTHIPAATFWRDCHDVAGYQCWTKTTNVHHGQARTPDSRLTALSIQHARPVCRRHIQSTLFLSLTNVALHKLHSAGIMQQRLPEPPAHLPIRRVWWCKACASSAEVSFSGC
jgi:hypothetical protein